MNRIERDKEKLFKITIFTPSYNRAHTLNRLFESLKQQERHDFEWIIVDDGSQDNTKDLIEEFSKENVGFPIRYIYQKNQGKHIAINNGIKNAKGEYFLVCDSDDYLTPNCIVEVVKMIEIIKENPSYSGVTYIHFSDQIKYDPNKYNNKIWDEDSEFSYNWEHHGEAQFVYKTSILKNFLFPVFNGEKYCRESLIHGRLGRAGYKVLYSNYVLAHGEYLEGGLTNNFAKMVYSSPRYSLLYIKERIQDEKDLEIKLQMVQDYWVIILRNKKYWYKMLELPFKLLLLWGKNKINSRK